MFICIFSASDSYVLRDMCVSDSYVLRDMCVSDAYVYKYICVTCECLKCICTSIYV